MALPTGTDAIRPVAFALGDPLLARLPAHARAPDWRIGHLPRRIPNGYVHARETGSTERMDPDLAEYYAHLRQVTAGRVFALERFPNERLFSARTIRSSQVA